MLLAGFAARGKTDSPAVAIMSHTGRLVGSKHLKKHCALDITVEAISMVRKSAAALIKLSLV